MSCPNCREKLEEISSFATLSWELIDRNEGKDDLIKAINHMVKYLVNIRSNEEMAVKYQKSTNTEKLI